MSVVIYAGDSKNISFPVRTLAGAPVDLTNANITWTLSEWAGGPALVTKSKAANDTSSIEITISQPAGEPEPNLVTVKLLDADTVLPGGAYVQRSRIGFLDATDTVLDDVLEIKDAPQ